MMMIIVTHTNITIIDIGGSSMLGYIPQAKIDLNDDDIDKNMALIDDIEELEDVDQIYHNMNI
jgi:transcriptional/translational regulatory protein YebC/TACO1